MPVDVNAVAPHVASTMPHIQQVFIDIRLIETPAKPLYIARKQIEQYAERQDLGLYFTSLSHKTIVYKGWLRSDQIKKLYLDLNHEDYQSKLDLFIQDLVRIRSRVGSVRIQTDY